MHFNGEFYITFNKELIPILKFFQKKQEETLPNSSYQDIILIPKSDKDAIRKLQTNISDEHRCKNTHKILATEFNNILKGSYTLIKWDLLQDARMVLCPEINQCDVPH